MLASLTIDDQAGNAVTLHETAKRAVTSVSGLIGVAPVRGSFRVRPVAHGAINETRWQDGRVIGLTGDTFSSVSIEDAISEFRAIAAPMVATLGQGNAVLMRWTEGAAGLALQRSVRFVGGMAPQISEAAAIVRWEASFFAEDPVAYTQALTTVVGAPLSVLGGGLTFPSVWPLTFTSAGGGTAAFTNVGNSEAWPLIRLYGACTNPAVLLGTRRIALTGAVAAGEYVELDLQARTITRVNAGVRTSAAGMSNAAVTQWFSLPANATSTIQMLADTFDASAHPELVARSAYL